jgi:hypothetical protein
MRSGRAIDKPESDTLNASRQTHFVMFLGLTPLLKNSNSFHFIYSRPRRGKRRNLHRSSPGNLALFAKTWFSSSDAAPAALPFAFKPDSGCRDFA